MILDLPDLPIVAVLPELLAALARSPAVLLEVPPGAGKSTVVPLALAAADQRILMLEPRRLAARAVAARMASTLREPLGRTVGLRTRIETLVSRDTRIEVVTEAVLTRIIQADPELTGTSLVIFDEFHERSLNADLGLALLTDARSQWGTAAKTLVMSATLDGARLGEFLDAPRVVSSGQAHPVDVQYAPRAPDNILRAAAIAVRRALADNAGDVLVFLPGAGEIRRLEQLLRPDLSDSVVLRPLYGELDNASQDQALGPAPPGTRKVVLASSIAETSLTIPGIRAVVDCGLARRARFDPVTGLSGLITTRASRASAEQRRGRAGRLGPGVCYRLWTVGDDRSRAAQSPPEILSVDLAPLALELKLWGAPAARLKFPDAPPAAALAQGESLLAELDALDSAGRVTALGRRIAEFGAHPRLGRLMLAGRDRNTPILAAQLAAVLSERDPLRVPGARDCDLRKRVELLRGGESAAADRGALSRIRELARRWRRTLGGEGAGDVNDTGLLLSLAYPDRIAQRREGGAFLLANGRGAHFREPDPLARAPLLVAAALDNAGREARILLAAPVDAADLEQALGIRIATVDRIEWDRRAGAVVARRERRLGALILASAPLAEPDPAAVTAALVEGIRERGVSALPWSKPALNLRARVAFARALPGADGPWPDYSDTALADTLESWLAPQLLGRTRLDQLESVDLAAALNERLPGHLRRELDVLAPSHWTAPSGRALGIDYSQAEPALAARIQDFFGVARTPAVANGRIPLVLSLLSPAGRPVQVTRDLPGFWARGYAPLRAELKRRYPKHAWPEDPSRPIRRR
jgi:ATP-dependent helicase HrpB